MARTGTVLWGILADALRLSFLGATLLSLYFLALGNLRAIVAVWLSLFCGVFVFSFLVRVSDVSGTVMLVVLGGLGGAVGGLVLWAVLELTLELALVIGVGAGLVVGGAAARESMK